MNRAAFEQMAAVESVHWWYRGMRRTAAQLLGRVADDTVLDVGCGTGGWLALLQPRVGIGVDLQPAALSWAARRLPGRVTRASATALPFREGTFDAVTSLDVLYHQDVASDEAALAEMARVLRPGGRVLVQVPAHDWLRSRHDREVATRERYTTGTLVPRMRRAGLRPERATYANALLAPVAVAWRLAEKLLPHGPAADLNVPPARINRALEGVLALESHWLTHASLPFGLSVIALARRPALEEPT